jgi:hypothetical protein
MDTWDPNLDIWESSLDSRLRGNDDCRAEMTIVAPECRLMRRNEKWYV